MILKIKHYNLNIFAPVCAIACVKNMLNLTWLCITHMTWLVIHLLSCVRYFVGDRLSIILSSSSSSSITGWSEAVLEETSGLAVEADGGGTGGVFIVSCCCCCFKRYCCKLYILLPGTHFCFIIKKAYPSALVSQICLQVSWALVPNPTVLSSSIKTGNGSGLWDRYCLRSSISLKLLEYSIKEIRLSLQGPSGLNYPACSSSSTLLDRYKA